MAELKFSDDFNSFGGPWQTVHKWSPNGYGSSGSWQADPNRLPADASPISVKDGILTITDKPRPGNVSADEVGGKSRIAARVFTEDHFQQQYGYYEASIQMPAGSGVGAAFWLMPTGGWPPEIDVAEMIGNNTDILVTTAHDFAGTHNQWQYVPDTHASFHKYGLDWTADKLTWYMDDKKLFEYNGNAPEMDRPMYPMFSIGAGNPDSWGGAPKADLVAEMKVDYVKIWDRNPYTDGTRQAGSTSQSTGQTTSTNDTVVNIGYDTLHATSNQDKFIFDDKQHAVTIGEFAPGDLLDFKLTAQDFKDVSIQNNGWATVVDYHNNHVVLPGVGQLSQDAFVIAN